MRIITYRKFSSLVGVERTIYTGKPNIVETMTICTRRLAFGESNGEYGEIMETKKGVTEVPWLIVEKDSIVHEFHLSAWKKWKKTMNFTFYPQFPQPQICSAMRAFWFWWREPARWNLSPTAYRFAASLWMQGCEGISHNNIKMTKGERSCDDRKTKPP